MTAWSEIRTSGVAGSVSYSSGNDSQSDSLVVLERKEGNQRHRDGSAREGCRGSGAEVENALLHI